MFKNEVTKRKQFQATARDNLEAITKDRHRDLIIPFREAANPADPLAAWTAIKNYYHGADIDAQRQEITNELRNLKLKPLEIWKLMLVVSKLQFWSYRCHQH
jgi:hypothetical protein